MQAETNTFINAHKILVAPVVVGLMWYFHNWSTEAFVYLALHGTYSLLWLAKQTYFPDRRFAEPVPIWVGIVFVFVPLASYYAAPYLLVSRHVTLPPYGFAVVLFIYIVGIFLHYVGDAQKYYTLAVKKGLLESGLFGRTRNPNYLGEIAIYFAFAVMSLHWLPFLVLGAWVFGFFVRNMLKKDRSLSRYPGFQAYKSRTGLLFPKILRPAGRAEGLGSGSRMAEGGRP
jgi:protein-S-isoprenylcysteine O-methyltransferase Ste14